jgi:hypothetical protein
LGGGRVALHRAGTKDPAPTEKHTASGLSCDVAPLLLLLHSWVDALVTTAFAVASRDHVPHTSTAAKMRLLLAVCLAVVVVVFCCPSSGEAGTFADADDDAGLQSAAPRAWGCTTTLVGCFADDCGDDCGASQRARNRIMGVFPSGPCGGTDDCSAPAQSCPSPMQGLCVASTAETCPKVETHVSAECDQSKMTPEYCLRYCSALGQRYMGLEAGSQCFCDNQIRNQAAAGSRPQTKTACSKNADFPNACHGGVQNPSACPCSGRPGDACGGFNYVTIYEISCSSKWGDVIVAVLLLSGAVYVLGGLYVGRHSNVRGLRSHPHYPQWKELAALVRDGVGYVRGGGGRAGSEPRRAGGGGGGAADGAAAVSASAGNGTEEPLLGALRATAPSPSALHVRRVPHIPDAARVWKEDGVRSGVR